MELKWVRSQSIRAAARTAPACPGVYAIGEVRRVNGLIVHCDWKYVGRATTQLNRRLRDHRIAEESNFRLRQWLAGHPQDLEIWYASAPTATTAIEIEARLIRQLDPAFNTLLRARARSA